MKSVPTQDREFYSKGGSYDKKGAGYSPAPLDSLSILHNILSCSAHHRGPPVSMLTDPGEPSGVPPATLRVPVFVVGVVVS